MNEIIIYQNAESQTAIEVRFDGDTVWLNQYQLADLFQTDRTSILKHLQNIYSTEELSEVGTCAKIAQVRKEGKKKVTREILHYNLDAILSVGYRVNSKRGTQFRQWSTQRLKEHLVQGYSINKNRLEQLQKTVELIQNTAANETTLNETKGLLDIITHYTQSFVLLNQYDSNAIETHKLNEDVTYEIQYKEAKQAITELKKQLIAKKEATELFGNEKDDSFKSSLQSIVQTFGG